MTDQGETRPIYWMGEEVKTTARLIEIVKEQCSAAIDYVLADDTTPPPASQERGGEYLNFVLHRLHELEDDAQGEVDKYRQSDDADSRSCGYWTGKVSAFGEIAELLEASPPSSAAEASINPPEIDSKLIPDAAEQAKPVAYTECTRDCDCVGECKAGLEKPVAEQAQAGELPPLPEPTRCHSYSCCHRNVYTADQMRDYANACRLAGGVTVGDVLNAYNEWIATIPVGSEDKARGESAYNWHRAAHEKVRSIAAAPCRGLGCEMNEQQKVQRYEPSGPGFGGVRQADDGDFVLYCDYDQLRNRLAEIEVECREAWKQAAYWRPRAEQAEAKLALAEQLLRECVEKREGLAYEDGLLRRIDAAIGAIGETT